MTKKVLEPGPDHMITIAPHPARVVVTAGGATVADTVTALALHEAGYPVRLYIAREDVDLAQLERTDHTTYCPYKGDAAYYSIPAAGEKGTNAVWTYEHPHQAVLAINERLAFYPAAVEIEETPL